MLRCMREVFVGAQQNRLMPDAQLRDERINRTQLHACPAACVSEICCGNVVCAIWLNQPERCEALDDLLARLGACESLKKLLQD